MAQHGQQFIPRVLPVLVGTTVEFPNQDNFYHNVFSVAGGERFDLGRFGQGGSASQTFTGPAVVVIHCEMHADMKAYVLVLDNPFFTTKDPERGTGLGLSTVWGLVQGMGGQVDLDSELGQGTTLAIRVPLATPAPAASAEEEVPAQAGRCACWW